MNCKINYWERDVSKTAVNHCEDESVAMWVQAVAAVVWSIVLEQEKFGMWSQYDHLSDHVLMTRT